jgi:LuxR family transcriptional regulator, maltose regulon positive regulatory protein
MPAAALAKLSRPKLYSAIPRARLFQRLDQAREHPAIWVCGPPGAGKTTLVASYVSERDVPGIWYQVDAGDGDPATFFYYLGIAVDQAAKGKHKPLPLLTPEFQSDLDGFSRRYFRELFTQLPGSALLVLDNVQEGPADSAFQSVITALVEEIPEGVNVLYISRTDPPGAFARHAATGRVAIVDWTDLRLTLDETRQIAAVKQPIGETTLIRLFEQCEGWAAGLTLMLERIARTGVIPESIEAETREAVFNYFAGTFFDKQPADARQVLLRTAFLPHVSPSLAEALTGSSTAGKLLEYLHRRHLFTNRRRLRQAPAPGKKRGREADEPTYEYHALFREFLLAKAQEEYTPASLRRLWEETAQLLETSEQDEEAIALYRDAEDWESFTRLVLKQAPNLLRQGRGQTLREWIAEVSDRELSARPWLSYWLGVSLIPGDQSEAIGHLERSFERFREMDDRMGQVACAARIIEAIYRAYVNYKPLERWIEVLDVLVEDLVFPDRDVELRAYCSLLLAIHPRHPRHPRLRASVDRVSRLLGQGLEPDQMVTAGDVLLRYFTFAADVPNARRVLSLVGDAVEDKSVAPVARLYWWSRTGLFYLYEGRYAEAEIALRKADEIGGNFGSHTATLLLHLYWIFLNLARLEVEDAARRVERVLETMNPARDFDLAVAQFAQSMLAAHTDTQDRAIASARGYVEAYSRVGVFYVEIRGKIHLAALLAQSGGLEEMAQLLIGVHAAIADTYQRYVEVDLLLVEALAELRHGDRTRARALIERAVSLDFDSDFALLRFIPGVLSSAFSFALGERTGVTKIKAWIERYQIPPDADAPEHWPWAVKLYLLGGLRLVCADQPVEFKRKTPQKPLELLVLLAASGPGGLASRSAADRLWPDLEADAALANIDTNVYRLRKLLGCEDALTSANGRLALNPLRCWVDAWSFERLASECTHASGEELVGKVREALELYRGHLLNQEGEQPWAVAFHQRLSARMLQITESAGKAFEEMGNPESAIELYQRLLALDNLAEPIYRRLMACLKQRGEAAEALKVYRRCRELLSVVLGVQPSQETQALAATLRQ